MANRRVSSRTRKVASKMAAALTSTDNRTQVCVVDFGITLLILWLEKTFHFISNGFTFRLL